MKKTNKILVDDEKISAFNKVSRQFGAKQYSRTQMKDVLHEKLGYSRGDVLLCALCDGVNPPIIRVKRGTYTFNPKPVFKDRLKLAFDTYTKKANPRLYNSKNFISIEDAIKTLKDAGYIVLKQL